MEVISSLWHAFAPAVANSKLLAVLVVIILAGVALRAFQGILRVLLPIGVLAAVVYILGGRWFQ